MLTLLILLKYVVGSDDSFPEFMRKAEDAIQNEERRVDTYLHRSTAPK